MSPIVLAGGTQRMVVGGLACALGLAAPAGLNAFLPLLIVAVLARLTPFVPLAPPFDVLTQQWVIALLSLLLLIEIVVDKVPGLDALNDTVQTVFRPTAGAVLFAGAGSLLNEVHPALAMLAGLLIAGGVHALKIILRPALTATIPGFGDPSVNLAVVSVAEDAVAVASVLLAIFAPLFAVALLLVVAATTFWLARRAWQRRRAEG